MSFRAWCVAHADKILYVLIVTAVTVSLVTILLSTLVSCSLNANATYDPTKAVCI